MSRLTDKDHNAVYSFGIAFGIMAAVLLIGGADAAIWDEESGSLPFTWDYTNFEGFNVSGVGTETLSIVQTDLGASAGKTRTIRGINNTSGAGLVYTTTGQLIGYEVSKNKGKPVENALNSAGRKGSLGSYYARVNLFAEPYVALNGKANKLSKLILEQNSSITAKKTLAVGETWYIGNRWTITAQAIDAKATPRQVWFVLSYNGQKWDDKVLVQGNVYTYVDKNVSGEIDVPLFVTYVDAIFAGAATDMVQLRYTWAISPDVLEINAGDAYGAFKVVNSTGAHIRAENEEAITLFSNTTVPLANMLSLKVIDDPNFLKFYPVIMQTDAVQAVLDYFEGILTKPEAIAAVREYPIPMPVPTPPFMPPGIIPVSILELNPQYRDMQLAPGDNHSFRAILKNRGNETIAVETSAEVSSGINLTISPSLANISAKGEQIYNITVSIPSAISTGYYPAAVIFTGEGIESQYLSISINVWTPPRVQILNSYIYDRVEVGNTYTYKIQVRNIADTPISIAPSVSQYMGYYGYETSELPASWMSINAPGQLSPRAVSNITITVRIPDDASGRYEGAVDLNIDDPSLQEARIQISLEVWKAPTIPFIKILNISKNSTVKLEVSAYQYKTEWSEQLREPSFETVLIEPDGNQIILAPVKIVEKGSVYYGSRLYVPDEEIKYNEESRQYILTYRMELERGEWRIGILPGNVDRFEYSIEVE